MEDFEDADIEKHAQVVIDSKNAKYNYDCARNIEGVDVGAHEQAVIESENTKYCYFFAKDVEGYRYMFWDYGIPYYFNM